MIAFLKTDELPRPTRVTAPPANDDPKSGLLTATVEEGSLLLKNDDGAFYRLGWKKDDADRRRALPPGEYTMVSYNLSCRDKEGKEWFIGASGKMIRKLTVRAGEEQKLALDEVVHVHCRAIPQGDKLQVQGVIKGEHHCGLTLYRECKRITIGYRVTDAKGKEVASGNLDYG
jgi:hypothetical protein